jgi:hypothetical protein
MAKPKDNDIDYPLSDEQRRAIAMVEAEAYIKLHRPNESKRPGGYFLSSNGIPVDANGNIIPEAEWRPEHAADVRARYPDTPVEKLPIFARGGADIHARDGGTLPGTFKSQPLMGIQPRPEA